MAGHFGREKTLKKLKKSPYFWPKMRETVEKWCKSCDVCMKTKSQRKNVRAPMVDCHNGVTMERVAVDILGPLTETDNGNRFIIVIADYWTKWTEAYPVRDHTAPTVAKVLVDQFFSKFGIPLILHSDQGREFESKLFQETCELLGVDKTRTSPWRPPCNGMVERFNRTLGAMMRQVTSSHQKDWDDYVPLLTMAYRSTVHETTGETPNKMMLGRELPMPSYLLVPPPEERSIAVHQ
jgi:transposase InsO family protein